MNLVESAPVLFLFATILAGCEKTPVEALCDKQSSCGLLSSGQSVQECNSGGDVLLTFLRKDESCAGLADRMEIVMSCASELSCEDVASVEPLTIEAPDELPAGVRCRAEKVALFDEMARGTCSLSFGNVSQGCHASDCPEGVLQLACDNRSSDGTCFDFTTPTATETASGPGCAGTVLHERCASPDTVGFCFLAERDGAQSKLRYYQGAPGFWTQWDAQQDCEKRAGTFKGH